MAPQRSPTNTQQERRPPGLSHRLAQSGDLPVLRLLMDAAIRHLLAAHLSPAQVEASFSIMGVDTQLVDDATYYVVEKDREIIGCGGWSKRATLFGGDHSAGRDARLLDPATEAARVRAMYTHPQHARQGIGRLVLSLCERAAKTNGFRSVELGATMGGLPLYRACGYEEIERVDVETPSGVKVPIVRMRKDL